MALRSSATALSGRSSIVEMGFSGGNLYNATKFSQGRTIMVILAQKKAKKTRKRRHIILETVGAFKVKRRGGKGKQIFGIVTIQDLVDIIKAASEGRK